MIALASHAVALATQVVALASYAISLTTYVIGLTSFVIALAKRDCQYPRSRGAFRPGIYTSPNIRFAVHRLAQ
jgi:hypothetical protein